MSDDNLIERRRASFEKHYANAIPYELQWDDVAHEYHGHHTWWIWTDKFQTWNAALDSAEVELTGTTILQFNGIDFYAESGVVEAIERAGLRVKS